MRTRFLLGVTVALAAVGLLGSCQLPTGEKDRDLTEVERALQDQVKTTTDVLTDPRLMSLHAHERFRDLIRRYATDAKGALVTPTEPGQPLVVTGVIRGKDGEALEGAVVYVFQTDAKGYYTPEKALDELRARLFAYLRTGRDGQYEFRAIRPGPYPEPFKIDGEERRIPEHIHLVITAKGYRQLVSQMFFEDDPLMRPAWAQENAKQHAFPVVAVVKDKEGVLRCRRDWVLEPE